MADDPSPPAEALATAEGSALAKEIVDMLESELVRFRHRVKHDHGVELDRARAAMTMLAKLVAAGVPWTARPDSAPLRIHETFTSLVPRDSRLAPILKREVAAFFVATTETQVVDDDARTPTALLRRAGAEPSLWWWAAEYGKPASCWAACGSDLDRLVQVALAFGVRPELVARALASAIGSITARLKSRYPAHRTNLAAALLRLSEDPRAALLDTALVAGVTKLAFEMTAAQQSWAREHKTAPDPLTDLAIHTFQLVEALVAAQRVGEPDLERFAGVASRAGRVFAARGLDLGAIVRKDLEEPVAQAIARL